MPLWRARVARATVIRCWRSGAWNAGQEGLATSARRVVDELIVHGSPAQCRATIQRYFDNGVTTSALALLPLDPAIDHWAAVRQLAPHAA